MRRLAVLVSSILLACPALAAGGEEAAPAQADPLAVELPMLVAPVSVDGRLHHYAYMRIIVRARDGSVAAAAHDKVPFLMDAMLRETHASSIALNGDPASIDGEGLRRRLAAAANRVLGDGAVTDVGFRDTIQLDGVMPEPPLEEPAPQAAAASGDHGGH